MYLERTLVNGRRNFTMSDKARLAAPYVEGNAVFQFNASLSRYSLSLYFSTQEFDEYSYIAIDCHDSKRLHRLEGRCDLC